MAVIVHDIAGIDRFLVYRGAPDALEGLGHRHGFPQIDKLRGHDAACGVGRILQELVDQLPHIGGSVAPVSYTHLDVYKRQGLSSSAALEVAAALLLATLHSWRLDAVDLVKLAQKAENEFVGVACGIMDQFASMLGQEDHALFLDCRTLDYEAVPLPLAERGLAVAVVNSGVRRGLAGSEYNTRRRQCEEAVQLLRERIPGIKALRDVGAEHLNLVNELPDPLAKRARHVVTENARVLEGVAALKAGDLEKFGRLLNASHESLRDDYEVSCRELDLLVELALEVPGVLGSRMTGAGFGGCTIALVPQTSLPAFKEHVQSEYQRRTGIEPEIFSFRPAPGARVTAGADLRS